MELLSLPKTRKPRKELGPAWATDEFFYETIQEFKLKSLFFRDTVKEQINYRIKPKFETASWTFKNGQHYIFLGTGILRTSAPHVAKLTPSTAKEYLMKYLAHEYGHALYTVRKVDSFARRLSQEGIPFSLWNLFEDSRIEYFKRKANRFSFDWLTYETPVEPESPSGFFFALVQADGRHAEVRPTLEMMAEATAPGLFARVTSYYRRALQCMGSTDLYPLLREWISEFPTQPDKKGKPGDGMQDLALSYTLMGDNVKFAQFSDDTIDADAPLAASAGEARETGLEGIEPDMKERTFSSYDFLKDCPDEHRGVDKGRVSQVVESLKRVLTETRTKRHSVVPSKRFNARRDLFDLPAYRHEPRDAKPLLDVTVFLDCSGSMSGKPMKEAKILLGALSVLAQHKRLTGYLVLTASTASTSHFHRFKFPLSLEEIESIHAQAGGEGLEEAMTERSNMAIAAKAAKVYVITDAELSDKPIRIDALHRQGICTTGIYVGSGGNPAKMGLFFDSFLIRNTIEEVVQALLDSFK